MESFPVPDPSQGKQALTKIIPNLGIDIQFEMMHILNS